MLKWFVYIVFLLVSTPGILLVNTANGQARPAAALQYSHTVVGHANGSSNDTIKTNKASAKPDLKVKEVPQSKKQPKPEKIEDADAKKAKPKRQRRPDGMDRPPEIPRRNDN